MWTILDFRRTRATLRLSRSGGAMKNDSISQSEPSWIDDNPFHDLPHGFEFHLDYFDRFVLQAPGRRSDQTHFSWLLTSWLQDRNQPWRESDKDQENEEGEDSSGLPPTAHRGVSTRSEAEGRDPEPPPTSP